MTDGELAKKLRSIAYYTAQGEPIPGRTLVQAADRLEALAAEVAQLRAAIGVCVPAIIRCFIKLTDSDIDRELATKVRARVEAAVAIGDCRRAAQALGEGTGAGTTSFSVTSASTARRGNNFGLGVDSIIVRD